MNKLILDIIFVIHIFILSFLIFAPFLSGNYIKLIHFIVIPFIIIHWVTGDRSCSLVLIETKIREMCDKKVEREDCYASHFIDPIYRFPETYKQFSSIIYIVTIVLWSMSTSTLACNYLDGKIRSIDDLVKK